jgi:hypothetical protein
MIRKKGLDSLVGQMVDVIRGNGKMVNKMEKVLIKIKMELKDVGFG